MRARRDNGQVVDPEAWQKSGGNALVAALEKLAIVPVLRGESASSGQTTDTTPAGAGFDPGDLAIDTHSTPADPGQTAVPSAVAPVPPGSDALAAPPAFLETLAATVPACLAAGWIDLAKREFLWFYGQDAPAVTADTGPVGAAITELFQRPPVNRMESLLQHSPSLTDDQRHDLREIFIVTDECLGVFLRSDSRADRALVIVSENNIDLGMMIARARHLMKLADVMI
jgi:hypothetical protein